MTEESFLSVPFKFISSSLSNLEISEDQGRARGVARDGTSPKNQIGHPTNLRKPLVQAKLFVTLQYCSSCNQADMSCTSNQLFIAIYYQFICFESTILNLRHLFANFPNVPPFIECVPQSVPQN